MLVFYSGWGYWEGYCDNELKTRVDLSPVQKECSLFELPIDAAKEITYQGETVTSYLLASSHSDIKGPKIGRPDQSHFVLCKKPDFTTSDPYLQIDKITKTYTSNDIKKPEIDTTKYLTETERNTMLKLIIGMAIDAYGYDPKSTRNSLTGDKNGLSARLKLKDIDISDDTIRKYLKEAKKIL